MLPNNECIIDEIKDEIVRYLKTSENENTTTPYRWDTGQAVLRGKFIALQAFVKKKKKRKKERKEGRKGSNKQSNITHKGTWKRITNKAQMSRRKEIIMIRVETNKIESK